VSNSLVPIITQLEEAYEQLLQLFDFTVQHYNPTKGWEIGAARLYMAGSMKPVISIQPRGRRKTDGWYQAKAWENRPASIINLLAGQEVEDRILPEIVISAEVLREAKETILLTLLHQMVHHVNYVTNTTDQDSLGRHRQQFRYNAERAGLTLGENNHEVIPVVKGRLKEIFDQINLDMDLIRKGAKIDEPKGSNLKKWSCSCSNIRATKRIRMKCLICGEELKYADHDRGDPFVQRWLASAGCSWKED
jgi:hypothetical protein